MRQALPVHHNINLRKAQTLKKNLDTLHIYGTTFFFYMSAHTRLHPSHINLPPCSTHSLSCYTSTHTLHLPLLREKMYHTNYTPFYVCSSYQKFHRRYSRPQYLVCPSGSCWLLVQGEIRLYIHPLKHTPTHQLECNIAYTNSFIYHTRSAVDTCVRQLKPQGCKHKRRSKGKSAQTSLS